MYSYVQIETQRMLKNFAEARFISRRSLRRKKSRRGKEFLAAGLVAWLAPFYPQSWFFLEGDDVVTSTSKIPSCKGLKIVRYIRKVGVNLSKTI